MVCHNTSNRLERCFTSGCAGYDQVIMKSMPPRELLQQFCANNYLHRIFQPHYIFPALAGAVTFPASLAAFQQVWKTLHVAAHMRIAPICGMVTISTSALVANTVCQCVYDVIVEHDVTVMSEKVMMRWTLLSIINFLFFAPSVKSVLPSHILHPGAFAKKGVIMSDYSNKVTNGQRRQIQEIGSKYGCHTCGKKYLKLRVAFRRWTSSKLVPRSPVYYADHSPPLALTTGTLINKGGLLYPQCSTCSYYQSSQVRAAKTSFNAFYSKGFVTHSLRFKIWKLFIPWPLIMQSNYFNEPWSNIAEKLTNLLERFI
ncbi:unnamed protein product [Clavelina lepadiformis]|uniref:Uncharacterized protein n=1 Tax=Clavelina lepadiformis TaxID=159417 RepID=A0ABP0FUS5_CLALP